MAKSTAAARPLTIGDETSVEHARFRLHQIAQHIATHATLKDGFVEEARTETLAHLHTLSVHDRLTPANRAKILGVVGLGPGGLT
jgi:hypothetical protein